MTFLLALAAQDPSAAAAAQSALADNSQMITSQLASAALLAYLLQWLKRTRLIPWVSEHTKGINYALTGIMSLLAAVGIHYNFDAAAGTLTIGGLHATTIAHGLWEWLKQWAFQQGAADMIFTKTAVKDATGTIDADAVARASVGGIRG